MIQVAPLSDLTQLIPMSEGPAPLVDLRRQARNQFNRMGLPSQRDEAWRFTSIGKLTAAQMRVASALANGIDTALIERFALPGAQQLVTVNGRLVRSAGGSLPKGVVACGLAEAIRNHPKVVLRYLGQQALTAEYPFVALNTTAIDDGAFLLIPPATVLDKPVQILHLSVGGSETIASFPRTLVVAGAGARATVIESFVGNAGSYLTSPVCEISVGAGATVSHFKLVNEAANGCHVATTAVYQKPDSSFTSHSISMAGELVRNDLRVTLDGEQAEATLNGLYLTRESQHVDNHLQVSHLQPNTHSRQIYKGVLDGASKAVFNGRIVVSLPTTSAAPMARPSASSTRRRFSICAHGASVSERRSSCSPMPLPTRSWKRSTSRRFRRWSEPSSTSGSEAATRRRR
jgi:Fe-S cluster assembly protein SufD